MAITYTGTGGLAVRLGKIFQALESCNVYIGTGAVSSASPDLDSLGTSFTEIIAQFASNEQDVPKGLFDSIESARGGLAGFKQYLVQLAQTALIEQVQRSNVLVAENIDAALANLVEDMVGAGTLYNPDDDVNAHVWSVATTATADTTSHYGAANTGTGVIRISGTLADGRAAEYLYAETIKFTCTQDGQEGGGGTARQETFAFQGEAAVGDKLSHEWPAGSGCSGTFQVGDAAEEESATLNVLVNSDFETTDATDDFSNWDVLVGVAGTDILEEGTVKYRGNKALEFLGDGATFSSLAQTFDSSTGSDYVIKPNTVYGINAFMRDSGAGAAAGTITFSLLNGSNAVINDDAGTANTITTTAATLTETFVAYGGFFRTPSVLPSTVKLAVRLTVAITSGESIYIDDLCMIEATELYAMGQYAAGFAGATDFVKDDRFTLATSETSAGEFQEWSNRVFSLAEKRIQLPSDTGSGETIADSLVG